MMCGAPRPKVTVLGEKWVELKIQELISHYKMCMNCYVTGRFEICLCICLIGVGMASNLETWVCSR